MAAATAARNTPILGAGGVPALANYPIAASTTIYPGTLVSINAAGNAIPATDTASTICVGTADPAHGEPLVNGTTAGAVTVNVVQGVARYGNGDTITFANVGAKAYVLDNQTVSLVGGVTHSIEVGVIQLVDANGVWVYAGLPCW